MQIKIYKLIKFQNMNQQPIYNIPSGTINPQQTIVPSQSYTTLTYVILVVVGLSVIGLLIFILYLILSSTKQCGSYLKSTGDLTNCFDKVIEINKKTNKTTVRIKYNGRFELLPKRINRLTIHLKNVKNVSGDKMIVTNESKSDVNNLRHWYYQPELYYDTAKINGLILKQDMFQDMTHTIGVKKGDIIELTLSPGLKNGQIERIIGHFDKDKDKDKDN